MTTQIIDQATYNDYQAIPVQYRSAAIQEKIEAYDAANNMNVDDERFVESSDGEQNNASTNTQGVAVTEGTLKCLLDELIAAGDEVIKKSQMTFTDETEKNVYLLTYLRACFGKTERFTQSIQVDSQHRAAMAALGSCLSWMPISTTDIMSREVKEFSKKPDFNYAVVNTDCAAGATYTDRALSNGVLDHVLGSHFIYHNDTLNPSHTLHNKMGNWKLAVTGATPEILNPFMTVEASLYRAKLAEVYKAVKDTVKTRYKNMAEKYKTQLSRLTPSQIAKHAMELAIAELHSPEMVKAVLAHIMQLEVTNSLAEHVKLACAWSLEISGYKEALPGEDYIATATLIKFAKETDKANFGALSRQTMPALLKELGLAGETGKEVLGISTTAIKVAAVNDVITRYVDFNDVDIKKHLDNITPKAA